MYLPFNYCYLNNADKHSVTLNLLTSSQLRYNYILRGLSTSILRQFYLHLPHFVWRLLTFTYKKKKKYLKNMYIN